MDFLDPKIERRNQIVLLVGYGLVAIAIAIATIILLYLSYGYGVNLQGKVTQNGLLFVSSQPDGATISLNGQPYKSTTNSRVVTPAGTYKLQITRTGYRTWQRQVVVNGGDVQHFDYPFLFPSQLKTAALTNLSSSPSLILQSPDKRWLLLGNSDGSGNFTQYDIKNPAQPVTATVAVPASAYTAGDGAQDWTLVEWAANNRQVLLLHSYSLNGVTGHEYVLLDRDTPANSLNLTKALNLNDTSTLSLYNERTTQYYVLDQSTNTLSRVNASDGSVVNKLDHVLAFKPYGSDMLLYVTDQPPTGKLVSGQVSVVLQDGQKTVTLRTLPAGATTYDLNLAQYSGDWYVGVGADTDMAAYVYKNPQTEQITSGDTYPDPWRRLPVTHPNYLYFSDNTQFLLAESGPIFVVYDFENDLQYHYTAHETIDQPQQHASWMDGDRLTYTSGGKQLVFDYDYRNRQILTPANPAYLPVFSADYKYLYNLAPSSADGKAVLTSTPLTFPASQ